ncbi:MAG: hypothetical protein QM756_06365 [Polyangiaceae bacterium]
MASRPVDASSFTELVREHLADTRLSVPLTAAVLEEDPIEGYLRCPYTPPNSVAAIGVSMLSEPSARKRLASMLVPTGPYRAPYGRATSPAEADALAACFLDAFTPRPTHFAEVDAAVLQGWTWVERSHVSPPFSEVLDLDHLPDGYSVRCFLDGLHDSVLVLGVDSQLALLINNGSD